MFQRKYSKSSKKRKNSSSLLYIFGFFAIFIIPSIYKISISNYIKIYFQNLIQINIKEKYITKIREIYLLLFNKYYLQILIPLLLVYNYCNVYKTFILLISLQFPMVISQILNLLLIDRIKEEKEVSNELLYAMCYPLFLWNLIFNSDNNNEKTHYSNRSISTVDKAQKSKINFPIIYIILFILFEYIINFLLFNDFEKIIFDAIIGLTLYIIFVYVFKFDTNSPKQFRKIIEFRLIYYFLIFLFFNLFFIIFCIHIIINNEKKIDIIKKIIFKYSFTSIVIGIILGAKYEYNYYFEKKLNIWAQYNFESDYEISSEEEESLNSLISSNNKRQWNNTSLILSFLRFLFLVLITFACLYSFLFLNYNFFILDLFLKYILPLNLFSLGLFHWYKLILKYLKVTNIFLLASFRESF